MELIKENKEIGRKVFELEDRFRKEWTIIDQERLEELDSENKTLANENQ